MWLQLLVLVVAVVLAGGAAFAAAEVRCVRRWQRHAAATGELEASGDLRLVQDLPGHANLGTIHVHTRVQPGAMAAAVDGMARPPDPALPQQRGPST